MRSGKCCSAGGSSSSASSTWAKSSTRSATMPEAADVIVGKVNLVTGAVVRGRLAHEGVFFPRPGLALLPSRRCDSGNERWRLGASSPTMAMPLSEPWPPEGVASRSSPSASLRWHAFPRVPAALIATADNAMMESPSTRPAACHQMYHQIAGMEWLVAGPNDTSLPQKARKTANLGTSQDALRGRSGDPYGTRTRVFAVRGRRPGPLDEGAVVR